MEKPSTELNIKSGNLKKISSKIEDSKNINPPFIPSNIPSARGTSIEINLDAGFLIKEVTASHQIVTQKISDKKMKIKLRKDRIIPDQDFTLNYTIQDKDEPQIIDFKLSNGKRIPEKIIEEIKNITDSLVFKIKWKKGDFCMIDNRRFMHGRTKISSNEKRDISVVQTLISKFY